MPDRPDYSALSDPEINRLCAERVGWKAVKIREASEHAYAVYVLTDPLGRFLRRVRPMVGQKYPSPMRYLS